MATPAPTPPPPARLLLRLHGIARLQLPGVGPWVLERKHAAIVAYLWLEGPTPRARLAGLLWPQASEDRARGNLRQRLSKLREAGLLIGDERGVLSLPPGVDLDAAEPPGAPLLASLDYDDCEPFARWLDGRREAERAQRKRDWLARVRDAAQSMRLDDALFAADQLLQTDRESEEAYRVLMEVYYLRGDGAAAIAAWDRCKLMLRELYGVLPGAATRQLGQTILDAVASAGPASAAVPASMPITLLRPPRLIERRPLLPTLVSGWQGGRTLCVCGDAGLGKSRLLAEWVALIGPCVVAGARPGDRAVPYASLCRLMLAAIDRFELPMDSPDAIEASRLLPRLLAVLPGPAPAGVQTDHERRQCLRAAARLLGLAMARGCRALVVDDLQFADPASVEALFDMADPEASALPAPLRLALGARADELDEPAASGLTSLAAAGGLLRIDLQPLGVEGVTELLASLGVVGLDAASLAPRLWRQVGGNPAFVLESVKLLMSLGGPAPTAFASAMAAASEALPLAPDIVAVVERRIGLLSPPARHLAQLAAVAGESWSVPLAAAALGCEPMALSAPLRELELRQLLLGRHFVHDVIAVAVRRSVAASVAEFMHRFVADHLVKHGGEPGHAALHWQACGEHRQAGLAFRQAAQVALEAMRLAEQRQLLDSAAACFERAGDDDALFDVIDTAVETVVLMGQLGTQPELLTRLENAARTDEQRLRALLKRQGWEADHGRPESVVVAQQAAERALAMGKPGMAFGFLGLVAWCQAMRGQQAQALSTLDARRDWVLSEGTALDRANFHKWRSGVLAMADQLQASIAEARLALVAMQAGSHHTHVLPVLSNMALAMYWRGELDNAEHAFTEAVQLRDRWHGTAVGIFDLHLAGVLCAKGDYAQAEQLLLRAVDELRGCGAQVLGNARTNLVAAENNLAALWLALGQTARAQALLAGDDDDLAPGSRWRRLILRLRAARFEGRLVPDLRARAQAMLAQRDGSLNQTNLELELACSQAADQALQVYERLLGSPVVQQRPGLLMHVAARAAQAELTLQHGAAAARHAALALPLMAEFAPYDIERAEVWMALAQVLQATGDAMAAARLLATGAAWLLDTAQERVAAPWRASFVQTNVANRRFLDLALARGAPAGDQAARATTNARVRSSAR